MADEADRSWQRFAESWPENWDPPGSCPRGCGQPADECICKPIEIQPFKTLTETLRETEKEIARNLEGNAAEADEWERIRQWPGEK